MWLCLGLLIGFFVLQQLVVLPQIIWVLLALCLLLVAFFKKPSLSGVWRYVLLLLIGIVVAFAYGIYHAQQRLSDRLSEQHEGEVARIIVRIHELATYRDNSIQFDVEVLDRGYAKEGVPTYLRVYWSHNSQFSLYQTIPVADMPEVRPGQVWEMSVKLSRPNTLLNPGGFDNESYLFRENIRALATVKGNPRLKETSRHTLHTYIQAWRHDLRKNLQAYWADKRYGAVLIALVIGDQQGISQEDWSIFNRSGMTHLVSISGSHITMLSGLATLCCLFLLKFFQYRGMPLSGQYDVRAWAYGAGIGVALAYCLLAGWGIPAQRTFLMLLLAYLLYLMGWRLSLYQVFLVTAVIVLFIDPWAILSTGFYLSFAAVAVLHILLNRLQQYQMQSHEAVWWAMLKEWCIVQLAMTFALAPFLMYFFHQVSLISPLVNAYAVTAVGLVVTPLALLVALLSLFFEPNIVLQSLAQLSHFLLFWVMELTQYLAKLSWASVDMHTLPLWVRVFCGVGMLILLLPKGIPYRLLALVLCIPVFLSQSLREGEWQAIFLDIGQAGAILVKTRNHVILFDTGVRRSPHDESGLRVIVPALRALGMKKIDILVVSHADLDHSGGLASVIQSVWVDKAYASFQMHRFLDKEETLLGKEIDSLNKELRYERCQLGKKIEVDQVSLRFLNQIRGELPIKSSNAESCVLAIEGKFHRLLLTGDMNSEQERELVQSVDFESPYHIVQVPHHGSKTSSSAEFVQSVKANYAIAQTGYHNRFKHPHTVVKERWQAQGIKFLNTAETGAVEILSTVTGLNMRLRREEERHYWYR